MRKKKLKLIEEEGNYHVIKKTLKVVKKNLIKVIYKKVHFPKLYS